MSKHIVMAMHSHQKVRIQGHELPLDMNWADGMVGVVPVFKNKKTAQNYAGKKFDVLAVELAPNNDGST